MDIATLLDSEPDANSFELARYQLPEGTRVLRAQRLDGSFTLTDHPVHGDGSSYLVESGLDWGPQLFALVEDYLAQAARHERCPMSASAIDLHDSSRIGEAIS
jgi:hypothetical protein